jgi:hypothetical protein
MKENTNYSKLERNFKTNGGYITREDIDNANIPSWFLSDFVKKNNLNKIAPGFYANDNFIVDDYLILQRRYPKYIYAGLSALYLLGLTDKIPTNIEVSAPQNYHPSRKKIDSLIVHKLSNANVYELGIKEVKTMFGRVRKIHELKDTNYMVRTSGERMALNTPIQGSSADIMKLAMIEVYKKMVEAKLQSKMILQIHDEIIIDALESEYKKVLEIARNYVDHNKVEG